MNFAMMLGVVGVAAASIRKDVGVRLGLRHNSSTARQRPECVGGGLEGRGCAKKVTAYHDRVRRVLDPSDPASSRDALTTRLPSDLENPHRQAQQRLADAQRAAFRRRLPQFEAQLEADKAAVDAAYKALTQAMNRLYETETGVNRLAPFGLHVVELADEQHREGREWRGWRVRAFPRREVPRREEISLLEGLG